MLVLFAAVSIAASGPTSLPTQARAFVRIERPALVNAAQWERAAPGVIRHERVVRDERGELQLQRVFEYQ